MLMLLMKVSAKVRLLLIEYDTTVVQIQPVTMKGYEESAGSRTDKTKTAVNQLLRKTK